MQFNAKKEKGRIIDFIREYVGDFNVVIGISGGKDSTIVSALCAEALGVSRVFGYLMPNGEQKDLNDSFEISRGLGINYEVKNIAPIVDAYINDIKEVSDDIKTNLPSGIRTNYLHNVAAKLHNALVVNTGNLCESWIGFCTKFGDARGGDFAPILDYTVEEVKAIGKECESLKGLQYLIDKEPNDGMSGISDEEKTGIPYNVLSKYIRTGVSEDVEIKEKIDRMHRESAHKRDELPRCIYIDNN